MIRTIPALCMMVVASAAQSVSGAGPADLSPAARGIAEAAKAIADNPAQSAGYNLLAAALVRRAQETSDVAFYGQAGDAVKKSLAIAPDNFDAAKIQVSILLGQHEYRAALEAAGTLHKRVADDVMVHGFLADADVELGNYKDAVIEAQWMLNLRPGNLPALTRAAHLRELFGQTEGAYELLDMAYQSTPPAAAGERASILTDMGHLRLASGDAGAAETLIERALSAFPGYPSALANLAQIRIAQKRYADAVELLQQFYRRVPRAANLYCLAEALGLAGREGEARRAFDGFEAQSLKESSARDNSNRELVFYYADHAQRPAEALKVARQEYAWRHDIYTLDAYAWALHVNGRDADARKQMEAALATGARDARLLHHAGEIALAAGDRAAAARYLEESAGLNTVDSEPARIALAALSQAASK